MATKTNDTNEVMTAVQDFYTANTGGALELSETVLTRLDTAIDRDPACMAALETWYDFMGQFDYHGAREDSDFHSEMDGKWIDCFLAVRAAAWLDGFACGRNPALLVYAQEGAVQR